MLFSKCHFVVNAVRCGGSMALWEKLIPAATARFKLAQNTSFEIRKFDQIQENPSRYGEISSLSLHDHSST